MRQLCKLSLLFSLFTALVGGQPYTTRVDNHLAKYDELLWKEPIDGPNLIPLNYKGLDYSIFQVDRYDGFIMPASGNQYAMSFEGRGNITAHSRHTTITLHSISYACSGGVPQPACAISIWGFRWKQLVAQRVVTFPALEPGHSPSEFVMNQTLFDQQWSGLTSVGFATARADNGEMIYSGLMVDELRYALVDVCDLC
ncbi:hypothetical protein B0T14DRAFT_518616 [Immersiella caudata]|uniref:Uncharacterized protein n=1 Tax=Immersiella caudata TaxID=314043 RepID=A0AA39WPD2_9PEZI|nr:hypothetical protein B0T14DRAFT_518616 [Immersiella caudata]